MTGWRPLRSTTARLVVALVAIAALTAAAVSSVTFVTVRSYLTEQRLELALNQAAANAGTTQDLLAVGADASLALTTVVRQPGSVHLVEANGVWFSAGGFAAGRVPAAVLQVAVERGAATQFVDVDGVPYLMLVFALPSGVYVEAVPLSDLDATLNRLLWTLLSASVAAVLFSAVSGLYLSRRLLRPLSAISRGALSLEAGNLASRLALTGDGDLDPIVRNFNQMADSLEARIEREQRFSSDVSHELRSPLTAMHTSLEIVKDRYGQLPADLVPVVDLVDSQVSRMEKMVVDLLEISRLGAKADPQVCPVDLAALVDAVVLEQGFDPAVNQVPRSLTVASDARYLARVLSNLMVNAQLHGERLVAVTVPFVDASVCEVAVVDAGAGLSRQEFATLAEPFARGRGASARPGAGLGLSIVRLYAEQLGVALSPERLEQGPAMVLTVPLWTQQVSAPCAPPGT